MDRVVYEGKEYIRRRGSWTFNNEIVTDTLQRKLSKQFENENPAFNKPVNIASINIAPHKPRKERQTGSPRKDTGSNYAIKCNFCDGGANEYCIGFSGLCSFEVMSHNTKRSREIWCGNDNNPCRMFLNGLLTREELMQCYVEDRIKDGTLGFCNEVKILQEWKVGAGSNTRNGVKQGRRRAFPEAKPDNLCVLTTRDPFGSTEADRYIFGAFIIEKVQNGNEFTEGYMYGNPDLAISFNSAEAHQLQYYKYKQWDEGKKLVWGTGLYRKLSDKEALAMLNAFIEAKETLEGKETAQRMKAYFLKYHTI